MKLLADKNKSIGEINFFIKIFKLHKSYLLLVSDQESMGIGSVSLGSPPLVEGLKSTAASYKLFGVDDKLLNTIIVEKASSILKEPVLALVFIKSNQKEDEYAKSLISFLNDVLNDIINNNEK